MTARAAAAVAAAIALAACGRDPLNMARQKKARPYSENGFFLDDRAMRVPPPGTVAQEAPRGPPAFTTGLEDGRPVERIPVPLTPALLAAGRHDFEIYCGACHGVDGSGDSPVARKMALRPPPSLVDPDAHHPPGEVFRIVTEGYGMMPSYAADIPVARRWGVVAYLEALRRSQRAPLDEAPPEVRRALEEAR